MKHLIGVPAKAAEVKAFLDGNRGWFLKDLHTVKELMSERRKTDQRLHSVYKIYSRGEKQDNDELKHPRRVRLKFNAYNGGKSQASLFDVPDIVGFTIVVPYPLDINGICQVVDEMINDHTIKIGAGSADGSSTDRAKSRIKSMHGRPIEDRGYFACHYNVSTVGVVPRPVCEIQIKTLLQDAWGAKSHDLTYKPQGQTDRDLIDSFNLLGDTLAKLDEQSDIIRSSIERKAKVRSGKRSKVQLETIRSAAWDAANTKELKTIFQDIENLKIDPLSDKEPYHLRDSLFGAFNDNRSAACLLMCFLAAKSGRASIFQHAQETVAIWIQEAIDPLERLRARAIAGLTAFSADNGAEAIDHGEEAVRLIEATNSGDHTERFNQLATSIFTSLAYYHADQIGSHEGEMRGSARLAKEYLEKSLTFRRSLSLLPNGLESTDDEIKLALHEERVQNAAFAILDNETFVLVQTADSEEELLRARDRLQIIYENAPSELKPMASLLFGYHEYCARTRLAEFESA
jgi:ppGpp synthetase/RelA/SpoT-type nucleotidyltranferase